MVMVFGGTHCGSYRVHRQLLCQHRPRGSEEEFGEGGDRMTYFFLGHTARPFTSTAEAVFAAEALGVGWEPADVCRNSASFQEQL